MLDHTIDAIYEAGDQPNAWGTAITEIGRLFRAENGSFYVESHGDSPDTVILTDVAVTYGISERALEAYRSHYCRVNPFNGLPPRFTMGRTMTDCDLDHVLGPGDGFAQSEYYWDWVRPQDQRHVIGQYFGGDRSGLLTAAFWRPAEAGIFSPEDVATFDRLIRHVKRSFDVGARLRMAQNEMETLIGRMPSAVFTLGPDRRVRQLNAMADALLKGGSALRISNGTLQTAVAQDQAALDRLIACALETRFASWAENARVAIRRAGEGSPLVAKAVAVAHRFAPFTPDMSASVILIVEDEEAKSAQVIDALRRRFGLSRAQARVAAEMRAGRSIEEAAEALGLGRETVRTHLKAIFERTGARRQPELVVLLNRETSS